MFSSIGNFIRNAYNSVAGLFGGGSSNTASALTGTYIPGSYTGQGYQQTPSYATPAPRTGSTSYGPTQPISYTSLMTSNPASYGAGKSYTAYTPSTTSYSSGSANTYGGVGNISYGPYIQPAVSTTVSANNIGATGAGGGGNQATVAPSSPSNYNYSPQITAGNMALGADNTGIIKPQITSTTGEKTTQPTLTPSEKFVQDLQKAQEARMSEAELYRQAEQATGLKQAQQNMMNIQNQLNAETTRMNLDLQSLRGIGAKEGVTEAVYGQQSAEVTREANARILPLQAQLAMAQNNVEMAKDSTDKLYSMYSKDVQNKYDSWITQAKTIYDGLTKAEQRKLDEIDNQKKFNQSVLLDKVKTQNELANKMLEAGNTSAYRAIVAVTPPTNINSPSFNRDVTNYYSNLASAMEKVGSQYGVQTTNTQGNLLVNALYNVNAGSAEGQQKRDIAQIQQLVNSGKTNEAKALLMSRVTSKMSSGERQSELDRRNTIDALETMQGALNDYVNTTGDTNIIKGSIENVANKIGATSDPKLASIKTRIVQATQKYRNAITGAAWGEQEDAEYRAIFPSISNTKKLNDTIISTMLDSLKANERNAVGMFMGGTDIYDGIFNVQQQSAPISNDKINIFDSIIGNTVQPTIRTTTQVNNGKYLTPEEQNKIIYGSSISSPFFNLFK